MTSKNCARRAQRRSKKKKSYGLQLTSRKGSGRCPKFLTSSLEKCVVNISWFTDCLVEKWTWTESRSNQHSTTQLTMGEVHSEPTDGCFIETMMNEHFVKHQRPFSCNLDHDPAIDVCESMDEHENFVLWIGMQTRRKRKVEMKESLMLHVNIETNNVAEHARCVVQLHSGFNINVSSLKFFWWSKQSLTDQLLALNKKIPLNQLKLLDWMVSMPWQSSKHNGKNHENLFMVCGHFVIFSTVIAVICLMRTVLLAGN